MRTLADADMPPAAPGAGRSTITDPDAVAEYAALLDAHPLVRDAANARLPQALRAVVRFTRYESGYAMMSAGEAPDRVALVLVGRCRVWDPADRGETIAWVGPGEVLGELSALAGEARSATVGAIRDVVVAEFDLDALEKIEDPRMALAVESWLGRLVARRALGVVHERPATMVLTALGLPGVDLRGDVEQLAEAARADGWRWAVRAVSDWPRPPTARDLERLEAEHDVVVLLGSHDDPDWTERAVRQADRVLVVADADSDPRLTSVDLRARSARAPHILLLMQRPDIERAQGTDRWLTDRTPLLHLHLRRGNRDDAGRCARLITGRGRGVAFAGASSRGLGYTGALAAFEELGLRPDIVGGNSSGAMAAACLASAFDSARTGQQYEKGLRAMRPNPRNVTLPLVAMLTGGEASRFFRSCFGDVLLEDLLIPCALTAVDLGSLTHLQLRRGPIWRAVRASTSLPAYWPPVVVDERVLVDGGVLQNVPVHPLMPFCREGFIVIGDLSQDPEGFTDITPYGTAVSGFWALLRRLWPFGRKPSYPTMPDVLFRTACLASLYNQAELLKKLDPTWIYVRPKTPAISLFGATPTQIPKLIEDTRQQTIAALLASERPAVKAAITRRP